MPVTAPTAIEPLTRQAWPGGLVATARALGQLVEHDDDRFGGGLRWSPRTCSVPQRVDLCVSAKTAGPSRPAMRTFEPIGVVGRDECSTFGGDDADRRRRAREHLDWGLSMAVEAELWARTIVVTNPSFNDGTAVTLPPSGVPPMLALALLVQAVAAGGGGLGMVHARPKVVELWGAGGGLRRDPLSGVLHTVTGIPVVAGSGYPGTGPLGQPVSTMSEWAFATGPVAVHLGPVLEYPESVSQATDRTTNVTAYRAERSAIATFDGCVLAAANTDPTLT